MGYSKKFYFYLNIERFKSIAKTRKVHLFLYIDTLFNDVITYLIIC